MQVLNPQDGMEAIKIVQWNQMEIVSRETQLENMSIGDINELRRCNQLMQPTFSPTKSGDKPRDKHALDRA